LLDGSTEDSWPTLKICRRFRSKLILIDTSASFFYSRMKLWLLFNCQIRGKQMGLRALAVSIQMLNTEAIHAGKGHPGLLS
jgi:hypothetical protein